MIGLIVKVLICPIGVLLSDWLFAGVQFRSFYQAILVGLILAVVGYTMELFLLSRDSFWLTNALDFFATALIVYYSAFFFPGTHITWAGALLTALLLTITEYFQHQWLIRSGRAEKTA